MNARARMIQAIIIHHTDLADDTCACGHRYELGEMRSAHKADAIDAALTMSATTSSYAEVTAVVKDAMYRRAEERQAPTPCTLRGAPA